MQINYKFYERTTWLENGENFSFLIFKDRQTHTHSKWNNFYFQILFSFFFFYIETNRNRERWMNFFLHFHLIEKPKQKKWKNKFEKRFERKSFWFNQKYSERAKSKTFLSNQAKMNLIIVLKFSMNIQTLCLVFFCQINQKWKKKKLKPNVASHLLQYTYLF